MDAGVIASDNYDNEVTVVLTNWDDEFTNSTGSVKVTYEITDSSGNAISIDRYVHVVEYEYNKLGLECNVYGTTVLVNGEIQLSDCTVEGTIVDSIDTSRINLTQTGTYTVYLNVTIDDVEFMFRTYIFVVDRISYDNDLYYYDKKRREHL